MGCQEQCAITARCLYAGLMDIGAGAFVFAGALTRRPQALQPVQPRSALHRATRGVIPLCALGEPMLCCFMMMSMNLLLSPGPASCQGPSRP